MRKLAAALALVCALGLSATTSGALAASPAVADCNSHGTLTHHYSTAQLQSALATMPADVKEYTDCYDVINRALLAQAGAAHGGAVGVSQGSGGSFLPTPVLVVLVLLALAAAALGIVAVRRR